MIIRAARPTPGDRLLDVACGPGLVVCAFAPHVREATGIDMTPAMLERAGKLAVDKDAANVTLASGRRLLSTLPGRAASRSLPHGSRVTHFLDPRGRAAGDGSGLRSREGAYRRRRRLCVRGTRRRRRRSTGWKSCANPLALPRPELDRAQGTLSPRVGLPETRRDILRAAAADVPRPARPGRSRTRATISRSSRCSRLRPWMTGSASVPSGSTGTRSIMPTRWQSSRRHAPA